MGQRPRNTFIMSPKTIVSGISIHARVILSIFVILLLGCDDVSIEDIVSNAPQMCSDFCQAEYECEWGHGEDLEEAKGYFQNQCVVDCAFYTQKGAMIIKRSPKCSDELNNGGDCISPEEREKPAARVLGRVVELYLECLWQSNLFQCGGGSFGLLIGNESACGMYADCVDLLNFPFWDGITWNGETGVCETPKHSGDDTWYYLEVIL